MRSATLFHYALCPASRAVRLALGECGIEHSLIEVKPWAPARDFLDINPAGSVPVLTLDGHVFSGVYPISEYLAETAIRESGPSSRVQLWPHAPTDKAEARRIADWFLRKFDVEVTQYLLEEKVYKPASGARSPPDLSTIRASRANLRYHLSYVSFLSERRKWLGGDFLGFGDFAAGAQLSVMDYLSEVSWSEFPEAKAWYARLKSRPAFRPLLADRLPGFNPHAAYADLDF